MSSNYSDTQLGTKAVEEADATSAPGLRLAVQVMHDMSKELEGGSPSVYKLHMNEEMRHTEGMIARQSFGGPDRIELGETEKVLLMVGATGAGKTTFIYYCIIQVLFRRATKKLYDFFLSELVLRVLLAFVFSVFS